MFEKIDVNEVPKQPTQKNRGEILKDAFSRFMDADKALFDARVEVSQAQTRLQVATTRLDDADQLWSEQAKELGNILMVEAPLSLQKSVQANIDVMKVGSAVPPQTVDESEQAWRLHQQARAVPTGRSW